MKSELNPGTVELLYQALETELGGVELYEAAVACAIREDLKKEWKKYLTQTRKHVEVMTGLLSGFGLDPNAETAGRKVVRHIGKSLVAAIALAVEGGKPEDAQIVAAECVVLAETKDHTNWELIGKLSDELESEENPLREAYEQVEDDEDEHLYHTKGWTRELWIEALGLPAVLPPPEEVKKVATAIGAARAEQTRDELLEARSKEM